MTDLFNTQLELDFTSPAPAIVDTFPAAFFAAVTADNDDVDYVEPIIEEVVEEVDTTTLNVGDFLYCSWGYSMTIVDFYQVTAISKSGKSCTLTPVYGETVEGDAGYTGKVVPTANPRTEKHHPVLKNKRIKISSWDGSVCVKVGKSQGNAYKFEEPVYFNRMD